MVVGWKGLSCSSWFSIGTARRWHLYTPVRSKLMVEVPKQDMFGRYCLSISCLYKIFLKFPQKLTGEFEVSILATYTFIYIDILRYIQVYLPIYLSVYLSTYLSIYPSIHPYLTLSNPIYLSIYLSIYLPIYLSIYLSIFFPSFFLLFFFLFCVLSLFLS